MFQRLLHFFNFLDRILLWMLWICLSGAEPTLTLMSSSPSLPLHSVAHEGTQHGQLTVHLMRHEHREAAAPAGFS